MSDRLWGWITSLYVAACLLLGGASAAGALANGALQMLAIILILLVAWDWERRPLPAGAKALMLIVGAYLLWGMLQLVPLPADTWAALPGRGPIAAALGSLGIAPPALPVSLAPAKSADSLLWLLPPAAVFLLVLRLPGGERRRVALTIIAVAVLSIVLGAFQIFGGTTSPLRFYAITNATAPVGFFANKNHLATLLLCALPLAAGLGSHKADQERQSARTRSARIIYGSVALFLTIGVAMNGSLAGYGLLIPAAFASIIIYRRAATGRTSSKEMAVLAALLAAFIAFSAAGPLNTELLSRKFDGEPRSRQVMAQRTLEAAAEHFPIGSGLGTFQNIYRTYEDPADAGREFANHAHNDYAEAALELGLPGILLIILFLVWWVRRSVAAWRGSFSGVTLARSASVMVGVVLLHSVVDYPIRTSAIAAMFAVACAMLVQAAAEQALRKRSSRSSAGETGARHLQAD